MGGYLTTKHNDVPSRNILEDSTRGFRSSNHQGGGLRFGRIIISNDDAVTSYNGVELKIAVDSFAFCIQMNSTFAFWVRKVRIQGLNRKMNIEKMFENHIQYFVGHWNNCLEITYYVGHEKKWKLQPMLIDNCSKKKIKSKTLSFTLAMIIFNNNLKGENLTLWKSVTEIREDMNFKWSKCMTKLI